MPNDERLLRESSSSNRPLIVSLGSINVDFSVQLPDPPGSADLLLTTSFRRMSGGKALNRAWLADRFGYPAALLWGTTI